MKRWDIWPPFRRPNQPLLWFGRELENSLKMSTFLLLPLSLVCILCALSSISNCDRAFHQIRYRDCKSNFEVLSVGVLDCAQAERCEFSRNKNYEIQIAFRPNRRVDSLKTAVWAHLGDAHGALTRFNIENNDACAGSNITCPVEPGQTYWYTQSVFILNEYPPMDLQVNWLIQSPDAKRSEQGLPLSREICVKFLAKVKEQNRGTGQNPFGQLNSL